MAEGFQSFVLIQKTLNKKMLQISVLMLLGPVHYIIIDKSLGFEQVFEESFYPNIVWLLLELQSLDIIKILLKLLLWLNIKLPGSP